MSSLKTILKASVFGLCSLASVHAAYAGPNEDRFNADMDKWQQSYPVLALVRQDKNFQVLSKATLSQTKGGTTVDVMQKVLPSFIHYIFSSNLYSTQSDRYFWMIESLDPVFRDLKGIPQQEMKLPVIEECSSLHNVYNVFHDGTALIDESESAAHVDENIALHDIKLKSSGKRHSRSLPNSPMKAFSPSKINTLQSIKQKNKKGVVKQLVY